MPDITMIAPLDQTFASNCGAGLAAMFHAGNDEWNTLSTWLYDVGTYARLFEQSRAKISESVEGSDSGPRVKL